MAILKLKWGEWLYTLGQTTIGGVAASVTAYLGTLIGNQFDKSIEPMNWKELGIILVGSAILHFFLFLKQSPLPPKENESTKKEEV